MDRISSTSLRTENTNENHMLEKTGNIPSECQARLAKTKRGVKYFCYQCQRYVLPDKNHELIEDNGKLPSPRKPLPA